MLFTLPRSTTSTTTHSRSSSGGTTSGAGGGSSIGIGGIPLVDFSRTPSPTRSSAAPSSSDADDYDYDYGYYSGDYSGDDAAAAATAYPSAGASPTASRTAARGTRRSDVLNNLLAGRPADGGGGGIGAFLFGTWTGWQVYACAVGAWYVAAGVWLAVVNRVVLWSGVYKFPYPLTATWIQLFFAHVFLIGFAGWTRWFAQPLRRIGLSALVAPLYPQKSRGVVGFSNWSPVHVISAILSPFGGIAGGGIFEFDREMAKKALPLALVFIGKVLLSNISFSYATFNIFVLIRIGNLPLTLLFTALLTRTHHSVSTLSSTLIAWLNLLVASIRTRGTHVTWEAIVAGIFSTLFTSLYPILLERTHRQLVTAQLAAGDVLTGFARADSSPAAARESGSKQSTRAYYQTLHYTSLLALLLLAPMVAVSGELPRIARNCYFLDVVWFWVVCAAGGLAAFAVFASGLALVRTTSALTVNFLAVPKAAVLMVLFAGARLPVYSWVGVALCWAGSGWYVLVKREEGRRGEKRRLEGR